MEVYFPSRRRHASGVAGRHEWFQIKQHRWTKGSIQTCKKLLPRIWRSEPSFAIKAEATGHLVSNFAYLLLACLCVLLHPSTAGPQSGWVRTLLMLVVTFLTASLPG